MSKLFTLDKLTKDIENNNFKTLFQKLYRKSPDDATSTPKLRYTKSARKFMELYPERNSFRIFSVPGRTEIIGNHTDHQGGKVICASIDLDIIAFAIPNGENEIRVKSEGYNKLDCIDVTKPEIVKAETGTSASMIRGIVRGFIDRGYKVGGFDAFTDGNIPTGSGLSSSAAFEIMISLILNKFFNDGKIPFIELAKISQYAENEYFGKPSGLMDQCGCAFGGIMMIDFFDKNTPIVNPMDIDFSKSGHSLVITDTKGDHSDLTHEYAAITKDMGLISKLMGKNLLSEIPQEDFYSQMPELINKAGISPVLRAMHFFEENIRVAKAAESLTQHNFSDFFTMINNSGISSGTILRNIIPQSHPERQELAIALALSEKILGDNGASRVHGGGFAGTIQGFVPNALLPVYKEEMDRLFGDGSSRDLMIRNLPACELADLF